MKLSSTEYYKLTEELIVALRKSNVVVSKKALELLQLMIECVEEIGEDFVEIDYEN